MNYESAKQVGHSSFKALNEEKNLFTYLSDNTNAVLNLKQHLLKGNFKNEYGNIKVDISDTKQNIGYEYKDCSGAEISLDLPIDSPFLIDTKISFPARIFGKDVQLEGVCIKGIPNLAISTQFNNNKFNTDYNLFVKYGKYMELDAKIANKYFNTYGRIINTGVVCGFGFGIPQIYAFTHGTTDFLKWNVIYGIYAQNNGLALSFYKHLSQETNANISCEYKRKEFSAAFQAHLRVTKPPKVKFGIIQQFMEIPVAFAYKMEYNNEIRLSVEKTLGALTYKLGLNYIISNGKFNAGSSIIVDHRE